MADLFEESNTCYLYCIYIILNISGGADKLKDFNQHEKEAGLHNKNLHKAPSGMLLSSHDEKHVIRVT